MKVAIIEANMTGIQHSYPNGIYTTIFSEIVKDNKIDLYCTKEHLEAMNIDGKNINFYPINVINDDNRMITKFFCEYKNSLNIINKFNVRGRQWIKKQNI